MDINQNIRDEIDELRNEIDEYLVNYQEGFSAQDSLDSIESLLSQATPDVKNNTLHYAVKVGEPELVDTIIDNGGDVNSVIEGQTPMMAAIIDPDSHWDKVRDIIETLLNRGANPSEVVDGKSVDDVIDSEINTLRAKNNKEADIRILENIKDMIHQRRDRIGGKKRKRKRTQKKKNKNKKRKSSKNKKRKSRRTRKHRK
jgi:ankyrin repeat protein